MFGTRASFPKSILYLFLALAFSGKVSSRKHEEFGCEFDSNDYSTLSTSPIHRMSKDQQVAWSELEMESNSVENFEKFGEPFKKLFSEASILNDLSLFTEFVTEYKKNSSHKPFKTFFNNYAVPIEPKMYCGPNNTIRKTRDPASYLIQELHDLKEKSVSPYLVSAYIDPFKVSYSSDGSARIIAEDVSQNMDKLIQKRVQDHLAGIIKIHRGNRTGYILIDPGYANGENLYEPVVMYVMKDGQPPHGEILRGTERTNQRGSVKVIAVGHGNINVHPFILVEHSLWQKIVRVLYYVGIPYCSFMENTIKLNMMRPYHGIIESNNEGNPHAYLWYKISKDTEGLQKNLFFERTLENVQNNRIGGLVPDTEVSSINKQLEIIEEDVLKNKTVFDEIIGLTKTLGLEKEPRKSRFQKIFG